MKTEQSIYSYLKEGCRAQKERKVIYFNRIFTAEEMFAEIHKIGGFLQEQGIRQGESIGIALPNMPEAVFALYGINAAGGVANFLHPRASAGAIEKLLETTKTRIIFIYDTLYNEIYQSLKHLNLVFVVCRLSHFMKSALRYILKRKEPKLEGVLYYKDLKESATFSPTAAAGDAPAVYIHSGGTTGSPKTVVQSSTSLNRLSGSIIRTVYADGNSYYASDSMLMYLPMFHGFGLGVCVHTLLPRAHIVILPAFHAGMAIKLIKKYRISHIAGVPSMFRMLLEHKNFKGDLSSLSHIFCGADRLPLDLKARFDRRLAACGSPAEILEGYGLTETTTVISVNLEGAKKPGSLGAPLRGNRAIVVDENGQMLPPGKEGELYLDAQAMMHGYLNDPEGTAAVFDVREGVRWLKTGDLGYMDGDGHIYFKERLKRSVKISALNVFPSEVEDVVNAVPEVEASCVARAETADGKPYTVLYLVLKKGIQFSETLKARIEKNILDSLMKYAVPREMVVTDKLYITPLGKVDYMRYERELAQNK